MIFLHSKLLCLHYISNQEQSFGQLQSKYSNPPCSFEYPIIYHLKLFPSIVNVMPGNPKSINGRAVNNFGFFSIKTFKAFNSYSSLPTITMSSIFFPERTICITSTTTIATKQIYKAMKYACQFTITDSYVLLLASAYKIFLAALCK